MSERYPIYLNLAYGDPLVPVTEGEITITKVSDGTHHTIFDDSGNVLLNPYPFTSSNVTLYCERELVNIRIQSTLHAQTLNNYQIGYVSEVDVRLDDLEADSHTHANKVILDAIEDAFLSEDRTKLDGIEDGATADQTGAEIKALYEAEDDTNAFTDDEKAKLTNIEANAQVNIVDSVAGKTGAVTLIKDDITDFSESDYATFSQGELANTALQPTDNISELTNDAGFTGDMSASEIKTAYESNADTNEFSDTEKSKLANIEENAQVNTVDSVNSQTGSVVLDADDIDDGSTSHKFVTSSQRTKIDNALTPGYNVSSLTNDAGYITELEDDSSPRLSADLNVDDYKIVTTALNRDIVLDPHGSGNIVLGSVEIDADQTLGAGQDGMVLTYNNTTGVCSFQAVETGGNWLTANDGDDFSTTSYAEASNSIALGGYIRINSSRTDSIGIGNNIDIKQANSMIINTDSSVTAENTYGNSFVVVTGTNNSFAWEGGSFKLDHNKARFNIPVHAKANLPTGITFPNASDGDFALVSDGDGGSPCLSVFLYGDWYIVSLGSTISI